MFRPCEFLAPGLTVEFSTHVRPEPDPEKGTGTQLLPDLFNIFLQPPAGHLLGRQESCISTIRLLSDSLQGSRRLDKLFRQPGREHPPVES